MKALFSILLLLIFSGCSTSPKLILPTLDKIMPSNLSWEDAEINGKRVHILTPSEWQNIQIELINRRVSGNICIDILNNYNKAQ